MSKHSPGTWLVDDDLDVELGGSGAWALLNNNDPECKANAHLISAAPDLLEAIIHLRTYVKVLHEQWVEDGKPLNTKLHGLAVCLNNRSGDMIDAAIAKATGETV
jgi:hypothetical protein